jgi:hypothetical protein
MGEYTFLLLNAAHYATRYLTVDCLNDENALILGRAIAQRHHVEVWRHARFIGALEAANPQEPEFGQPIDPEPVARDGGARDPVFEGLRRA